MRTFDGYRFDYIKSCQRALFFSGQSLLCPTDYLDMNRILLRFRMPFGIFLFSRNKKEIKRNTHQIRFFRIPFEIRETKTILDENVECLLASMIHFATLERHSTLSHHQFGKIQFEHETYHNRWDHRTTTFTFVVRIVVDDAENEMKDSSRTIQSVCDEN